MRAALPALALVGCANVLGIPSETTVESFAVEANVLGAHGASDKPLRLILTAEGSDSQMLDIPGDGVIAFPRGLLNGVTFHVMSPPMCSVMGDGRAIQNQIAKVDVRCDGLLGLADFNFSAPVETVGEAPNFRTYGSLLTQWTSLDPIPTYAESTSDGYKGGVQVPAMGVPVGQNDSFEARISNITSSLPTTMRSFFTTVDLSGLPMQFGYGKSPAGNTAGHYGSAIDTFDNYVVVGSPTDGRGTVALYSRYGRAWTEVARFDGASAGVAAGARFGAAVAISKDFLNAGKLVVAVGAPGDNRVFLYKQNGMTWDRTSWSGTGEYGAALAVEKTNMSSPLLLIGAPSASTTVPSCGRVESYYIQTLNPGPSFTATNQMTGARFGAALSIALGTPFVRTVIIGAPGESSTGDPMVAGYEEAGGAYTFDLFTGTSMQRLRSPNPGAFDHFGAAVAFNDDAQIAAVGAPLEDSGNAANPSDNSMDAAGAVYLFSSATPNGVYIKAPNVDVSDGFGTSISLHGAVTSAVLVVGAPYEDSAAIGVGQSMTDENAPDAGAVYLYSLQNTTATFKHYIKASNAATGDAFGASLVLASDLLLVAAPYEDSAATGWNNGQGDGDVDGDNGAVYAFR